MKKHFLIILLLASWYCQAGKSLNALTSIIYVNVHATGGNNGESWGSAYQDLQVAMNAASTNSQIWIAAGTYYPTQKPSSARGGNRDKTFYLNKDLKLYGGFQGIESETELSQRDPVANKVILSGDIDQNDDQEGGSNANNTYHVFITSGLTGLAIFDGLNITGGNADGSGTEYDFNLGDWDFDSARGGGQYNMGSSPTLTNCNIYNNTAGKGGGQHNIGSSPTLTNCNIYNNNADHGGGQYNDSFSSLILTNCNIYNNTADNGGGQYNTDSSPIVKNSIFWENKQNTSTTVSGADIFNTATITYSITQVYGTAGTDGIIKANPLFVDPENGDFHLQSTSPAIDAGTEFGAPPKDFQGTFRPQGDFVDIGA